FVSDAGAVALADCGSLVNSAGGTYSLSAAGDITQTSVNDLSATTLCLESTGSIGTSLAPILTNAANLTANAANDVFVSDSGAVALVDCGSLTNSAGGTYSLTASGSITVANNTTAGGAATFSSENGTVDNAVTHLMSDEES